MDILNMFLAMIEAMKLYRSHFSYYFFLSLMQIFFALDAKRYFHFL